MKCQSIFFTAVLIISLNLQGADTSRHDDELLHDLPTDSIIDDGILLEKGASFVIDISNKTNYTLHCRGKSELIPPNLDSNKIEVINRSQAPMKVVYKIDDEKK